MTIKINTQKIFNLSPPSLLAIGFLSFIIIGTLLLKLPIANKGNLSWMDALFTATSAVTITGLSVVNLNESFNHLGQVIILLLIQTGGLGFMTFAILAALSLAPKLGLKQQMMAQDSLGQTSLSKVTFVAKGVVIYTLFFELIGVIILSTSFIPIYGFDRGLYYSIFYSISAFNNAGFSLFNNSLINFQGHYLICLTISILYTLGGIGFLVLIDIKQNKRWSKLTPNSKLILSAIATLNIVAFILIWLLEANNPLTLGSMNIGEQAMNAWFQATVPRSSGFNTIDTGAMEHSTTLLTMLLMFIGGGSLSTAGGIKVGTFVILLLCVISFLRRNEEIRIFNHSISQETTYKALAVAAITGMLIFVGCFTLFLLEPKQDVLDLMFEVVSAACTVGLSRGVTGELHDGSLFVLSLLMYTGRLGPLTLAYLIATPKKSRLKHANANIQIG
ncbi:TrkH family potassium uptake protein [Acinetobacter sp. TR11]|uniref:TrkH family potassium uptake protein n=1 Tax=Acinetobacter sp. TR11 TaxID=3003393 RepID=UPI0022AC7B14|nr:TrkH family potassium uptake protein [Acinetobacter sp. TR11]WAU72156.1 TrkH family potassium uptake protein [Acinetobacter sp. TR11]